MIRERGRVVELEHGTARVMLMRDEGKSCVSCACCGGLCSTSGPFNAVAPEGLHVGDEVTIEIPAPAVAALAALVFFVPVLLFIAGVAGAGLLQNLGAFPGRSGTSVITGFGLAGLWYVALGIYDRRWRRTPGRQPRIVAWPGRPRPD